jgi:hypothetical protein
VRIALQLLLNLKRQTLHAATHVGVARRDPHPNTRLPEPSSISMTPDLVRRPLVIGRDGLAASNPDGAPIAPISTGSKIARRLSRSVPPCAPAFAM